MKRKNKSSEATALHIPLNIFIIIAFIWTTFVTVLFFSYHRINFNLTYLFRISENFRFSGFLSLIYQYCISLIILIGIAFSAFFIGDLIIKKLKLAFSFLTEQIFFSTGLGLGTLALAVFGIGLAGLLYRTLFYSILAILFLLGALRFFRDIKTYPHEANKEIIPVPFTITAIFLFILLLINLIMSYTPEMFYDSLNYHLGLPNYFVQYNRILPAPYKSVSHYPLNVSMLFLIGLLLKDVMIAKLINFLFLILTVTGIFYFCKKYFRSVKTGIIAAAAYCTMPTILFRSWAATTDIGLSLFTFLSLSALINSITSKNNRWLVLSAVFAGLVAGTKYPGAFFLFGLAAVIIFTKDIISTKLNKVIIWCLISFAVFSPWLIKNYIETGNPLHPFMAKHFDIKYPHQLNTQSSSLFKVGNITRTQKMINLIKLPWTLSIQGGGIRKYSSPDYYMLGAVYITFIPLLIFIRRKNASQVINKLIIFSLVSYLFWGLFASSKIKYFVPAIPALSILTGYTIKILYDMHKNLGTLLITFFFVMISGNFLFILPIANNIYHPASILTGSISWDKYLSSSKTAYPNPSYAVYKHANNNLGQDAKILIFGDAKCLYLERKFVAFSVHGLNPLIEFLRQADTSEDFYNILQQKGFTHIIVNIAEGIRTAGYETMYFTQKDFAVLTDFWKKHIKELFNSNNAYLYEILEKDKASNEKKKQPFNAILETYRAHILSNVNSNLKSKKWDKALKSFEILIEKGVADYNIYYYAGVCAYNIKNKDKALSYVEKAYTINPTKQSKDFFEHLKRL